MRKIYVTMEEGTIAAKRRLRDWLREYKSLRGCADCQENDPIVLEFDHVRGEKLFTIGTGQGHSRKDIEAEIEKCDVVCANCHKRRTNNRRLETLKEIRYVNAA